MQLRPHQQRALDAMQQHNSGQIHVPTGGGKTYIMIADCLARAAQGSTTVVVAPRILLANQLCEEFMEFVSATWTHVMHVHSGETRHFSTTKPDKIALFNNTARAAGESCIVFTTYHSLHRVVDSGIDIDCIYFDEAHNSTGKHFFTSVFAVAQYAKRRYFFTATPRNTRSNAYGRGMNNSDVYGPVLCNVPAPELIEQGAIVPPTVVPFDTDLVRNGSNAHEVDKSNLIGVITSLDPQKSAKILVAAPNTKVLWRMLSQTDCIHQLSEMGYEVLHITSKHGAYVNDKKVSREVFFKTLSKYGADSSKRFVVFHYSILSEGINCPGLTHAVLLRNLPIIEMAQTIGRVIRVDNEDRKSVAAGEYAAGAFAFYKKPCGFVTVPVPGKGGQQIAKRLQNVLDAIFVEGVPPAVFA